VNQIVNRRILLEKKHWVDQKVI